MNNQREPLNNDQNDPIIIERPSSENVNDYTGGMSEEEQIQHALSNSVAGENLCIYIYIYFIGL